MEAVSTSFSLVLKYSNHYRDEEKLGETTSNLTISGLGQYDQGNYSCAALNSVGAGESEILVLDIKGKILLGRKFAAISEKYP